MTDYEHKVFVAAAQAAVYVPSEGEAVRIDFVDEDAQRFTGTGEETGESYAVDFSEVDLDADMFYKLTLVVV